MVIGILGENCSGKSTLATRIKEKFGAEIYSGKDYLRMAKSENEAKARFSEKLRNGNHYAAPPFRFSINRLMAAEMPLKR